MTARSSAKSSVTVTRASFLVLASAESPGRQRECQGLSVGAPPGSRPRRSVRSALSVWARPWRATASCRTTPLELTGAGSSAAWAQPVGSGPELGSHEGDRLPLHVACGVLYEALDDGAGPEDLHPGLQGEGLNGGPALDGQRNGAAYVGLVGHGA